MKYRAHNAATDQNQPEIVKALRDRGALVVVLGQPVDLLVGWQGKWFLAEVKSSRSAKVQPKQKEFLEQCANHAVPLLWLYSVDDVTYFFGSKDAPTGRPDQKAQPSSPVDS